MGCLPALLLLPSHPALAKHCRRHLSPLSLSCSPLALPWLQVIPAEAMYRKSVEALASYRIAKATEIEDVRAVSDQLPSADRPPSP